MLVFGIFLREDCCVEVRQTVLTELSSISVLVPLLLCGFFSLEGAVVPFEFMILAGAVGLGLVQVFAAVHLATKARGTDWNLSPRDMVMPPLPPLAGRLERVVHNFLETFAFFAAAAVMVVVAGKHSTLTVIGSSLYLGARVFYVFAYANAIRGVRTGLWLLSVAGIILLLIALFL